MVISGFADEKRCVHIHIVIPGKPILRGKSVGRITHHFIEAG
jgi:hypothetical protein